MVSITKQESEKVFSDSNEFSYRNAAYALVLMWIEVIMLIFVMIKFPI